MIWDKGVGEFVKAAKIIKDIDTKCRFLLVGIPDTENPTSIPEKTLRAWHSSGVIEWLEHRDDMPKILSDANIVVLPTIYGEGVPKILIEAAACGRAIVTTNIPGCREVVRHNENGILVPPGSLKKLLEAIMRLIEDKSLREKMGANGRKIVEKEFSEEIVARETMALYESFDTLEVHR